ncbi:MAG: universal stress protein [Candidatus Nitrosotenuis sp.]
MIISTLLNCNIVVTYSTMFFKNILVPHDGSKFSQHAFKIALDVAKKYDSKITVVNCIEVGEFRGPWYTDSQFGNAVRDRQEKIVKENFAKLEVVAKKEGLQLNSYIFVTSSVVKQLVAFAKSNKIDLVIMGSHGKTGWSKMLLGSVANGVSQKIHCPVLIVK